MKRKIRIVAATRRGKSAFRKPAAFLLACCALVLFCGSVAAAQDQQPAAPAGQNQQQTASPAKEMPPMPAAPSEGKAIICIYRPGGAVGSAAHDHLYVNGVYLATLLNGEYAWIEVDPGTVVVTGMAKMYYGPSIIMSTRRGGQPDKRAGREDSSSRPIEGKIYYMKWTSGMFATGIKVVMVDPGRAPRRCASCILQSLRIRAKTKAIRLPRRTNRTPAQPPATPAQP